VGTTTGQILVYGNELQLLWAASLDQPAVGMLVMSAGLPALPGIIASISEEGYLCLSYMGTDPPSQVVNTAKAALNYDNMDAEHRRLLTVIREATSDKRAEPTDRLILRAQAPSGLDEGFENQGWQGLCVTVKLFVSFTGPEALTDVTISVSTPAPFHCEQPTQVLRFVKAPPPPKKGKPSLPPEKFPI